MASNGSVASVQSGGLPTGWRALLPGLVVALYLVVPLAAAAALFRRRDPVGVG
jgi:hypothetical protein